MFKTQTSRLAISWVAIAAVNVLMWCVGAAVGGGLGTALSTWVMEGDI